MKSKVIITITIIIFVVINLYSIYCKMAVPNEDMKSILKDILPQDSIPIVVQMENFFVSNPWVRVIYIQNYRFNIFEKHTGGQNQPLYQIISEVIDNNLFNYIWVINVLLILIIIVNVIILKRNKEVVYENDDERCQNSSNTMFNKIQVREIEKGGNKVKNIYREKN